MKLTLPQKNLLLELQEFHIDDVGIECFPKEKVTVYALEKRGYINIAYEHDGYTYVNLTRKGKDWNETTFKS